MQMITLFNIWHYAILSFIFFLFLLFVLIAMKQKNKKLRYQIIFSSLLIAVLISGFAIFSIDKYTKIATLYNVKNKRILSTEKIMYSGTVKNEGNYEIGEVVFEIKLVNRGHVGGNIEKRTFFKPSGFFDFFVESDSEGREKVQQITHKFVVAKNLKPGQAQEFRVYFDYPPYFRGVSPFTKIYAH